MEDSYRHRGLRKALVELLREKGIKQKEVLAAIARVPRHVFFDKAFVEFAYQDKAFPIGSGQTISQPYTVAIQTELLNIKKGEKVLEIGTGYQTAILIETGAKVFTIERQKNLYLKARVMLEKMSYRPKTFFGDGFKGLPSFAPFDKILVTAGAPDIPVDLVEQLRPGGIMVIPVDSVGYQTMIRLVKSEDGQSYTTEKHGNFQFVPMLKNKARD